MDVIGGMICGNVVENYDVGGGGLICITWHARRPVMGFLFPAPLSKRKTKLLLERMLPFGAKFVLMAN